MTGSIAIYGPSQKILESVITSTMIDGTAQYTCPTGKKAIVTLHFMLVAIGAGSPTFINVGGKRFQAMTSPADVNKDRDFIFELAAGQDFHSDDGSGFNNATVNFTAKILELPAT